jgi:hypothetical protein
MMRMGDWSTPLTICVFGALWPYVAYLLSPRSAAVQSGPYAQQCSPSNRSDARRGSPARRSFLLATTQLSTQARTATTNTGTSWTECTTEPATGTLGTQNELLKAAVLLVSFPQTSFISEMDFQAFRWSCCMKCERQKQKKNTSKVSVKGHARMHRDRRCGQALFLSAGAAASPCGADSDAAEFQLRAKFLR